MVNDSVGGCHCGRASPGLTTRTVRAGEGGETAEFAFDIIYRLSAARLPIQAGRRPFPRMDRPRNLAVVALFPHLRTFTAISATRYQRYFGNFADAGGPCADAQ
ncbi:hypothetical protein MMIN_12220 [Mycolicibacter minnesotensis]|nr:hypothetical protein MMIN_12220 [Mycolicibacter minnesotensis]